MDPLINRAIKLLGDARVHLATGLAENELRDVEERFEFTFSEVHRRMLSRVLPLDSPGNSTHWPDWRAGSADELQARLDWPVEGVVFDVLQNGFWIQAWGPRPRNDSHAERTARENLRSLARMVPFYGHRYVPSQPCAYDPPVFSIYQTDVIYYGDNLIDYLAHEFKVGQPQPQPITADRQVPFWSDLVCL